MLRHALHRRAGPRCIAAEWLKRFDVTFAISCQGIWLPPADVVFMPFLSACCRLTQPRVHHCLATYPVTIVFAPQFVHISGCSDCTIVLGAVGRCVRLERCEKVQAIFTAVRAVVSSCHNCTLHLGINQSPGTASGSMSVLAQPWLPRGCRAIQGHEVEVAL